MTLKTWNEFAADLALYARTKMTSVHRGALLVRRVSDGTVVAGVFGNDNYIWDGKARREVELVRRQLREAAVEELGFGISADGFTWSLLVRTDEERYRTELGRAFQREMLKILLEDAVWGAWHAVSGEPAAPALVPTDARCPAEAPTPSKPTGDNPWA